MLGSFNAMVRGAGMQEIYSVCLVSTACHTGTRVGSMDISGDDDRRTARTILAARMAVPFVALAALITGVILAVTGNSAESFGWFAYAPLSSQGFVSDGVVFLSGQTRAGVILAGVGLLALTFWAGYRLGRRRS